MGHKLSSIKNFCSIHGHSCFLSEIHGVVLIPIANGEAHCHRRINKERAAIVGLVAIPERHVRKRPRLHFLVVFIQGCDGDGVRRLSVGHDGVDVEHRRSAVVRYNTCAVELVRTAIRN